MKKIMKKNNVLFKSILVLLAMAVCISLTGRECFAAAQRLMLSNYEISCDKVYPGDSFNLKFVLKNTSKYEVRNIKVTVSNEDGNFIPEGNAGTLFVEKIGGEKDEELTINLKAGTGLEEKTYKIAVKTEYEGSYSTPYEVTDYVYVPVSLKQDAMVSDLYIAEEDIRLGDNIEILATVNNTGAATLYNVKAEVSGSNIGKQQSYVGNIAPGKNASVDVITKTTALFSDSYNDNKILITYEDKEGNVYKLENKITSGGPDGTINVQEANYADFVELKKDTRNPNTARNAGLIVIAAGVLLMIVAAAVARKRKKRRMLEEF